MIHGRKVVLRTVRERDLPELYEKIVDQDNRGEWMPLRIVGEPAFRQMWQHDGFWGDGISRLLICDPEDAILGSVFFFPVAPYVDGVELGYHLFDETRRGQGLTTEALELTCRFLFDTRKINRLQLGIAPQNAASRRVAEKCGFREEGVMRGAIFHRGAQHDVILLSRLRGDPVG